MGTLFKEPHYVSHSMNLEILLCRINNVLKKDSVKLNKSLQVSDKSNNKRL